MMFHLGERTLEKLVAGSIPVPEVERIRHHVRDCRACARKLEEWRDTYPEIDHAYPEIAGAVAATRYTGSGLVIVPAEEKQWSWMPPQINFANVLWVVALMMAILVGYGAHRLRGQGDGFEPVTAARLPAKMRPENGNGAGVPMVPASPRDTLVRVTPQPAPLKTPVLHLDTATLAERPVARRARAVDSTPPRSAPAPTLDTRADPPMQVPASPSFRSVNPPEASRRLGGALGMLRGLEFDHIEVGPASAVPGAVPGLTVVRVVYRTPDGARMLLDQQLITSDSTGLSRNDPSLERGQTAFGTAPNGVSVATWLDPHGYRLSLVAQAPADSMKQLVKLVE